MKREVFFRGVFYLSGLLLLALGIILNTKAGLGVSPIISVAYSISVMGNLDFGNITFLLYGSFVMVEMVLHTLRIRREQRKVQALLMHAAKRNLFLVLLMDVLQLPLSLVFTRFLNLFSYWIPDFSKDFFGSFFGSVPGRLLVLFVAIALTGIGAAMSLDVRVIPNPGDGIVQAIADTVHKEVGLCKNCFDISCIVVTCAISLIFARQLIGIGIGTVLAMIGVGRFVALFNHVCLPTVKRFSGLSE